MENQKPVMDLEESREMINQINDDMLVLFTKRMEAVTHVAAYKKAHDLPIFHPEREEEIIRHQVAAAPDDIKGYVRSFFTYLMEAGKCYQVNLLHSDSPVPFSDKEIADSEHTKVACQGTQGAYQYIAAGKLFQKAPITCFDQYRDVFSAVESGDIDYAILPIENSNAGTVGVVYDLLSQYQVYINKTYVMKITNCIAAKPGTSLSDINAVYSYRHALDQCTDFLDSHPKIQRIPYANTALAARFVAECEQENIAAICSEESASLYGLQILQRAIDNNEDNYTKFIVISKNLLSRPDCREVSVCIHLDHVSGSLNQMLTKFSLYSINMTKIESRPIGDREFKVMFYLNFDGNLQSQNVKDLLNDLSFNGYHYKILGTY